MIETNIDDISLEYLGKDFQENLLKAGAIDFFFSSVQMKKGRPGLKISVLSDQAQLEQVSDYILENTTTIGLRYYPVSRSILEREIKEIDTSFGKVSVKFVKKPSGSKFYKIEYDSLQELSRKHNLSLLKLQMELTKELHNVL